MNFFYAFYKFVHVLSLRSGTSDLSETMLIVKYVECRIVVGEL